MKSLELFVGAGGLALGMGNAGFEHTSVVEWDANACDTIRLNQRRGIPLVTNWNVFQGDARDFDYSPLIGEVAIVSGGPPCQPFSLGGSHKAYNDSRDMFPEAVRAVRELRPKAFVFENVKGLLRQTFATYVNYIQLQMQYPFLARKPSESWEAHLSRLEKHHTAAKKAGGDPAERYRVVFRLLNAANFGVPQRRERVFFVGIREDLGLQWSFPDETHSADGLLFDQWVTGEYWDRHRIAARKRPQLLDRLKSKVALLESDMFNAHRPLPWRTVRDVISDLPDPELYPHNDIPNHVFNGGAKPYPGHTGSPLDEPAKTLKAGDHGVPGGENMVVFPDGRVRYFTVREAARLQTFPDHFVFSGSWSETMRQLGNAVPVKLAEVVATSIAKKLRVKRASSSPGALHA